jgi:hypothetical protein
MIQLMSVPARLLADVASGGAYVSGAMVKDAATHQILAHLQPTRLLSQAISLGASGPFGVAGSVIQSGQLLQIKSMIETLQTVASIGAAASVLNLGVSVGGFAMVLSALKKADAKLDALQSAIKTLDQKADSVFFADIITVLRRAESGFELPEVDRRDRWRETEDRLDSLIERAVQRLAVIGLPLEATRPTDAGPDLALWQQLAKPEVLQMLACLSNLVGARTEALLCLQRPAEAAQVSRRSAAWLSIMPTDARALAIARADGRALSSEQVARVAQQARVLTTWVSAGRGVATERSELFQSLGDRGVDTLQYVQQVRDHAEPVLLMLPHRTDAYMLPDA